MLGRFISPPRVGRRWLRSSLSTIAGLSLSTVGVWASSSPVARAGTASGGPGTASFWNETSGVQGFATALSPSSKVWYTLGNGGLENVFYPQTDNPDTGLTPSSGYTYSVTATDTDGNESAASNSVTATTTANNVEVVIVAVPSYTDQTGLTVYMAGTLSALGGGQGDWAANGIAFTRVDATHWRATIHAAGPTTLSYKYNLGGAWANDEETASCGYVGNRSMQINGGTETDTVANWAGPYTCGSSPPPPPGGGTGGNGGTTETIAVTVPADTPASAQVYLAGNLSVLGGGQGDWAANGVLMSRVDATHFTASVSAANASTTLQYKYTLNGTWSNNEETGSCGYVQNRSLTVNGGTQTDTVANWKGYGGC